MHPTSKIKKALITALAAACVTAGAMSLSMPADARGGGGGGFGGGHGGGGFGGGGFHGGMGGFGGGGFHGGMGGFHGGGFHGGVTGFGGGGFHGGMGAFRGGGVRTAFVGRPFGRSFGHPAFRSNRVLVVNRRFRRGRFFLGPTLAFASFGWPSYYDDYGNCYRTFNRWGRRIIVCY